MNFILYAALYTKFEYITSDIFWKTTKIKICWIKNTVKLKRLTKNLYFQIINFQIIHVNYYKNYGTHIGWG